MARTTNTCSIPPSNKAMLLDGKTLAQKLHALIGTSSPYRASQELMVQSLED